MKRTAVAFAILTLGAAAFAADSAPAGERRVGGLAGRRDREGPARRTGAFPASASAAAWAYKGFAVFAYTEYTVEVLRQLKRDGVL